MRPHALALTLLGLGACAAAPQAHETRPAPSARCGAATWYGYRGEPVCAALADRVIAGEHRSCDEDSDCALVHPGASCVEQAASAADVERYRALAPACTDPAGGACPPSEPVCIEGCCETRPLGVR